MEIFIVYFYIFLFHFVVCRCKTQLRPTRYFPLPTNALNAASSKGNSPNALSLGAAPPNSLDELNPANLLATFSSGVVQGFVEQISRSAVASGESSTARNSITGNNPFLAGGVEGNSNDANSLQNLLLGLTNARNSAGSVPNAATSNWLAALLNPTNDKNNVNSQSPVPTAAAQTFLSFPSPAGSTSTSSPPTVLTSQPNLRSLIARLFPGARIARNGAV